MTLLERVTSTNIYLFDHSYKGYLYSSLSSNSRADITVLYVDKKTSERTSSEEERKGRVKEMASVNCHKQYKTFQNQKILIESNVDEKSLGISNLLFLQL